MKKISKQKAPFVLTAFLVVALCMLTGASVVKAQEPFIGEIRMFGGNFAPRGWAFCDGQLLPIATNTALFSILGTTYGGDGRTTFGLPNLQARIPLHPRQGPGLTNRRLGEMGGTSAVTLSASQIPSHTHEVTVNAYSEAGDSVSPENNYWAASGQGDPDYNTTADAQMPGAVTIPDAGGSQLHNNMPPYLGIHFIIALQGLFPSWD